MYSSLFLIVVVAVVFVVVIVSILSNPFVSSSASYEGNKALAQDSHATAGTRVGAAIDAVGDKASELSHATQKEAHKQRAMH